MILVPVVAQLVCRILVIFVLAWPLQIIAGGPPVVATINRAAWPDPIHSREAFDAASFAENILYAKTLFQALDAQDTSRHQSVPQGASAYAVVRWRNRTIRLLQENLRCSLVGTATPLKTPKNETDLREFVKAQAPILEHRYPEWFAQATRFHQVYVKEQLRLAAMFPLTSSEILNQTDREVLGPELPDRTFLLTFDDGPTTPYGETDRVLKWLRSKKISAVFFILGDALARRVNATSAKDTSALYAGFGIGSHGQEHKVQKSYDVWRRSFASSRSSLLNTFHGQSGVFPYRPPYGNRSQGMSLAIEAAGDIVVLWNIDSQDWNLRLPSRRIKDRVVTLMLLWRRGIVLFHDIHPAARHALPDIFDMLNGSGVTWAGMAELNRASSIRK